MINPGQSKSPSEFAEEVMGSADEQLCRWYEKEMAWRQALVDQYDQELLVLREHFRPIQERMEARETLRAQQAVTPPGDTDPELGRKLEALRGDGLKGSDPEATQAMTLPERDPEMDYDDD
jgi:hypothetical protein